MYHKWQSYDVWFLRYGAWRTEFFVILDNFLHFYPPKNPKNQNFEEIKKLLEILPFYISLPKIIITCYTVLTIWRVTDVIVIFHFGLFFVPFYPHNMEVGAHLKMPRDFVEIFKNYALYIHTFILANNFQNSRKKGKKEIKTYLKWIFD